MILVGDRIAWSRYPGGREIEGVVVRIDGCCSGKRYRVRKVHGDHVSKRLTTVFADQKPRKVKA
jgi:hypothetical protein